MVSNENWEVICMHVIETYDLYSVAAFVESNTTHVGTPRSMNYNKTSPQRQQMEHSHMFDPSIDIRFGYWKKVMSNLKFMDCESEQRNKIVELWKEAGMTEEDIGLMLDMDEVVSRDFLRAVILLLIQRTINDVVVDNYYYYYHYYQLVLLLLR